jgi:hypothetical protein
MTEARTTRPGKLGFGENHGVGNPRRGGECEEELLIFGARAREEGDWRRDEDEAK